MKICKNLRNLIIIKIDLTFSGDSAMVAWQCENITDTINQDGRRSLRIHDGGKNRTKWIILYDIYYSSVILP